MKCFLLLVQEGKVIIPAPVWEVVARAAAAPPPRLSALLHERCLAPKLLSDMSYSLVLKSFNLWHYKFSATLLATAAPLRSACTQKGKNRIMLPKETRTSINEVFVGSVYLCNPAKL